MIVTNIQLGKATQMTYAINDITQQIDRVGESDMEHLASNLLGMAHARNDHLIRLTSGPIDYLLKLQEDILELKKYIYRDYDLTVEVGPAEE